MDIKGNRSLSLTNGILTALPFTYRPLKSPILPGLLNADQGDSRNLFSASSTSLIALLLYFSRLGGCKDTMH